jgi:asparagine N-glycosylation enzyme membrane subunit Stt3
MNTTLLLLIALVFIIQFTGDRLSKKNSIIDKIKRMKRFTLLSLITIALLFLYSCTNAKKDNPNYIK